MGWKSCTSSNGASASERFAYSLPLGNLVSSWVKMFWPELAASASRACTATTPYVEPTAGGTCIGICNSPLMRPSAPLNCVTGSSVNGVMTGMSFTDSTSTYIVAVTEDLVLLLPAPSTKEAEKVVNPNWSLPLKLANGVYRNIPMLPPTGSATLLSTNGR